MHSNLFPRFDGVDCESVGSLAGSNTGSRMYMRIDLIRLIRGENQLCRKPSFMSAVNTLQ